MMLLWEQEAKLRQELVACFNPISYQIRLEMLKRLMPGDSSQSRPLSGLDTFEQFEKVVKPMNCKAAALIYLRLLRDDKATAAPSQRKVHGYDLLQNLSTFLTEGGLSVSDIGVTHDELVKVINHTLL